jgi:predicted nuclease of restriction endonuclease-like (RecB) superfamily
MLDTHLKLGEHNRVGNSTTNFRLTLLLIQSDLAQQVLKAPYSFDFLTLSENYKEKELEDALTENITRFLLELGSGFTYVGRQISLQLEIKSSLLICYFII